MYITGRRQDVLDNAVAKLGESARGIVADASKKADMLKVAGAIKNEQGKLDILFANAGGGHATPLAELTEEKRAATEIPAGRVGTSHDIGNALVFLASDHGSFIRGIDLVVDGGMTRIYQGHQ